MPQECVISLLQLFAQHGIDVYVDGGWGVDALLGKQTRVHTDLDIALCHAKVPLLRKILEREGYREIPRDDSRECNFVLVDGKGHEIDVHSYIFDEHGTNIFGVAYPKESLTGSGIIGGYPVKCIEPAWMVKFHSGYPLDENDYHDVRLLCEKFGFVVPEEYKVFANK